MNSKYHKNGLSERSGLVEAGRAIEAESFRIIDAEMGEHAFPEDQWQIVRRVIHTTGDFDYSREIRFHPDAVASGAKALISRATIFADTRMIGVGLSPWRLKWFGTEVIVPASDPDCRKWAEEQGVTLSVAAFRHAGERLNGSVVAIGNAPTALIEVMRLTREAGVRPALIIGVPVGFVRAAESKDLLFEMDKQPFITVLGRKGGSTAAVSILHALLEWARIAKQ